MSMDVSHAKSQEMAAEHRFERNGKNMVGNNQLGSDRVRFETFWHKHVDDNPAHIRTIQGHCSRPTVNPEFFKHDSKYRTAETYVWHDSEMQEISSVLCRYMRVSQILQGRSDVPIRTSSHCSVGRQSGGRDPVVSALQQLGSSTQVRQSTADPAVSRKFQQWLDSLLDKSEVTRPC